MMTKCKWVKEPYKSVFEHPTESVDLSVAVRRKPRKPFDWKKFVFVQFLRVLVLGFMVMFAGLYSGVLTMAFYHEPTIGDWCAVIGIGLMTACIELGGVYAIVRMHKFQ